MTRHLGKLAYGATFVLLWPALLAAWAHQLDRARILTWPTPLTAPIATLMLVAGAVLVIVAMRALWMHGDGLPMNAFPPRRRVDQSAYRVFAHPIYVGHALIVFAVAALAESAAGFWIVAPIAALATVALVHGYEGRALRARLGPRARQPLVALPQPDDGAATLATKCTAILLAWGSWAIAYALFSQTPVPPGAVDLRFAFEFDWPHAAWWLAPYSLAYPFVALCPLALGSNRELRRFIIGVWVASVTGFAIMLIWPGTAAPLPLAGGGALLELNRAVEADWLACPSFHVAWSFLAAHIYARRWPRLRVPAYAAGVVIAASCIGTGSHALVDVPAGIALAVVAASYDAIVRAGIRMAEAIANSWGAWHVGPLRVISHAPWTATAAAIGVLGAALLAGPGHALHLALVVGAGLAGALLFGWLVEGRHLSRPFGYFGFLLAGLVVLAIFAALAPASAVTVSAPIAAVAPLAQAIGRGRCLVQGCCHGGLDTGSFAIRVSHPMSRVSCVAHLRGASVRATQLLSAATNIAIAVVLLRLWATHASATLICGLYLVLTGLARFAEEGSRGEPQTPVVAGLTIYQWLSVLAFVAGIVVTAIPGTPVVAVLRIDVASVWIALLAAVLSTLAMSVDWPNTTLPMSRLAPPSAARF